MNKQEKIAINMANKKLKIDMEKESIKMEIWKIKQINYLKQAIKDLNKLNKCNNK